MNFPCNFLVESSTRFALIFCHFYPVFPATPIHHFSHIYLLGYQAPEPHQWEQGCWMTSPHPHLTSSPSCRRKRKKGGAEKEEVGCLQTVVFSCCCKTFGAESALGGTGLGG